MGLGTILPAGLSPADRRLIGHLEAVRHVAGEGDVDDGRTYPVVLHDVDDARGEEAGLPGEGAPRLEDELELGMTCLELLQHAHEALHVVVLTRHQVSAAHIQPLDVGEDMGKVALDEAKRHL